MHAWQIAKSSSPTEGSSDFFGHTLTQTVEIDPYLQWGYSIASSEAKNKLKYICLKPTWLNGEPRETKKLEVRKRIQNGTPKGEKRKEKTRDEVLSLAGIIERLVFIAGPCTFYLLYLLVAVVLTYVLLVKSWHTGSTLSVQNPAVQ